MPGFEVLEDKVTLWLLATLRWWGIVQICPFWGGQWVPGPVRVGLAVVMAGYTVAFLPIPALSTPVGLLLVMAAIREAGIGLLMGFSASLLFFSVNASGRLLDDLRGTTVASLFIPQVQTSTSPLGWFYFHLFTVLYMGMGGHRWFFHTVIESFRLFPPTLGTPPVESLESVFQAGMGLFFRIIVRVAAPALAVLMLTDALLGLAQRMTPALDVFFMAMGLKPAFVLLVVALTLMGLLTLAPDLFRLAHATMVWTP